MQIGRLVTIPLVVMLISGIAGSSYAKDGERLLNFIQLCIEDEKTGFNWENGAWVSANFTPDKLVVSKITLSQDPDQDLFARFICEDVAEKREDTITENFLTYHSCLSVQKLGSDTPVYMNCYEGHFRMKEKKNDWEVFLECESSWHSFNFRPNGSFIKSYVHGQVDANPKNDYKDSLSISVGKCADITG